MSHLTGRIFITVKGKRLNSKEGAKIHTGGIERTGETGDVGVLGYTEKPTIPFVECVIKHDANTSLKDIQSIVDTTISADTDTKRSFIFQGAWCAKANEMSNGEVSVRFEAMKCDEV
jgi:hypothetical protein